MEVENCKCHVDQSNCRILCQNTVIILIIIITTIILVVVVIIIIIIIIMIIIKVPKKYGISPNRLSTFHVMGFSKSVKINLIGQRGFHRERLGSEHHNEHRNNSAANKLNQKSSLVL